MKKDSLLLRYLEEQPFVDMFMQGHIRLNSLGFFWGEHDEVTKDGQIDTSEGLVCGINAKEQADCKRGPGYQHCNLLCCHKLDYVTIGDTVGWYTNEYMNSFGDYVVIIKDKDEFQRRLVRAASRFGYKCGCNSVDYNNRIAVDRDCFDKPGEYAYQNEWRVALYRGETDRQACVLDIGGIDDIAEYCLTARLNNTLENIFRNHDYVPSHERYYGNIERYDLFQLFCNLQNYKKGA